MSTAHKVLLFAFCLSCALEATGQAARSPFSSFGIGEPYGSALVNQQGMAGVGVSYPQFYFINNQNPALLVYNSVNTAFQAGIVMEQRRISNDTLTEKSQGGNMNYLVTAFPIKPGRWTTSVGLTPYTSVNYLLEYEDQVVGRPEAVRVTEDGSGGLTQLYWSNGVRIVRGFSVGVKASYIFSSIVKSYENQLVNTSQPINYIAGVEEKSYVQGFTFGVGASFSKDSLFNRSRYRLSIGAVYNFATDLRAKKTDRIFRTNSVDDRTDESVLPSSVDGSFAIPASFTVGVTLSRNLQWAIGTEFSYQDWRDFRDVNGQPETLQPAWRGAIGGEITPDIFDADNYLKRMTYRVGFSIEDTPFLVNGNSVRDLGINFGFSLPAGRENSVDLAFRYGKRGDRADHGLEEGYFKVYFGITFNDRWFIKRRYD